MFVVDWNRDTDQPTGRVSYRGAVSLSKLRHGCPTTVVLPKGSTLTGTHTHLQADNYGILFRDLYKHLNHLVEYLLKDAPPRSLTENYKNPYTGETTLEILSEKPVQKKEDNSSTSIIDETFQKKDGLFNKALVWFKSLFR